MTESESVALPLGDTPTLGWIVGFEPTYTGATTLCLNHLTIPTMLVIFSYCCVATSFGLGCVPKYTPFEPQSVRLALCKNSCASYACYFRVPLRYIFLRSQSCTRVHSFRSQLMCLALHAFHRASLLVIFVYRFVTQISSKHPLLLFLR